MADPMTDQEHARAIAEQAQDVFEQLLAQIGDITHGNYDAETFRVRVGDKLNTRSWPNIIAAALSLTADTARAQGRQELTQYCKHLSYCGIVKHEDALHRGTSTDWTRHGCTCGLDELLRARATPGDTP